MDLMPAVICLAKTYGLVKGVLIYAKLKLGFTSGMHIPNILHPIYLRKGSSDIPAFQEIFSYKEYEIELDFIPKTIIDAGANVGLASIYFANKYPKATVIAIEPEKTNFDQLTRNTNLYKNIHVTRSAISRLSGITMNVVDTGGGNWAFRTEEIQSSNEPTIDRVNTITISDLVKQFNLHFIDILKIDIEGAEAQLFESGYEEWLPLTRCLIIELHDRFVPGCSKNVFTAISKYNFSYSQNGENLVFVNKDQKVVQEH